MEHYSHHESKQHGTLEFPAEYYYIDSSHPRYHMSYHWHREWELVYIIDGAFQMYAGEEHFVAHSGDAVLIRDGLLHGGTAQDCVYECFVFDLHGLFRNLDAVKKYLRPVYQHQLLPQIYYSAEKDPAITAAVSELMQAFRNQELQELNAYSSLSRLFSLILRLGYCVPNPDDTADSSHRIRQLKNVLEFIENNYAAPISLETLAGEAGMNPKYFCRFFRSITHQTPLDYVNYYRIEQAAQLLQTTEQSITDVGMECGFNDSSYFVKVFRKYRGVTPNQYRRGHLL